MKKTENRNPPKTNPPAWDTVLSAYLKYRMGAFSEDFMAQVELKMVSFVTGEFQCVFGWVRTYVPN